MRKTFYPESRVVGATPSLDSVTGLKKGWNMPKPLYHVVHRNNTRVPIYQGISAHMANHYRSQAKREIRKEKENV